MTRTIFTDAKMELEVNYIPATESNKAKVLLLLSPVDKNDIALFNEIELEEFDVDELIAELEIFKDIISAQNKNLDK